MTLIECGHLHVAQMGIFGENTWLDCTQTAPNNGPTIQKAVRKLLPLPFPKHIASFLKLMANSGRGFTEYSTLLVWKSIHRQTACSFMLLVFPQHLLTVVFPVEGYEMPKHVTGENVHYS